MSAAASIAAWTERVRLFGHANTISVWGERITECQDIQRTLEQNHDGKWGLRVYRCTYGNDDEWRLFMDLLNAHARHGLSNDPYGPALEPFLDWDVQDDEEKLRNASKADVRRMFREWQGSITKRSISARYDACIYADAEVVQSVIHGDQPNTQNPDERANPTAYVVVLDWAFREPGEESDSDYDSDDEHDIYPPVESRTIYDVGWVKVAASNLIPRTYSLLRENGWRSAYVRPPAIMDT